MCARRCSLCFVSRSWIVVSCRLSFVALCTVVLCCCVLLLLSLRSFVVYWSACVWTSGARDSPTWANFGKQNWRWPLLPSPSPSPVCPSKCTSKSSPCMPAPRVHVETHVRVVRAHTGTFWTDTRGFSACHTTPHTHTTTPPTTPQTKPQTPHTTQHNITHNITRRQRERRRKKAEKEREEKTEEERQDRREGKIKRSKRR